MRKTILIGVISLLALAPFGHSGPISGGFLESFREGERSLRKTVRFRGGEKAVVLARGRDDSSAVLSIKIYDSKNNVVAQTTGKSPPSSSMVAVFWYPPRDEDYTIDVTNSDKAQSVFVTIK
jgi:hypothetical protein